MAMGNSVEALCLDDPNSGYLTGDGLPIHALGKARGAWGYHETLRPWLKANLSRFEAVISHGLWQYPSFALSKEARRQNHPPYFVIPHGMLDPWFQRAPERRLKAIRNWFYWKFIEHQIVEAAAGVLFTCAEEMRLARETFRPYRPQRQINMGYGVSEPPKFDASMMEAFAQKCPTLKGRGYFLFLGRIDPKKGVDMLIQAYSALFRSRDKTDRPVAPLVIAGPGLETPFGQKMQDLAASVCPPGSILWPGMLTGGAKWGALYGAEAFVLTSHQENFGIAVVESLACGIPVLISNQVNIWREIEEDRAGLVAGDTLAGATKLLHNWNHLSLETKALMSKAARASYESHFGVARSAQNLLSSIRLVTAPNSADEPVMSLHE
jgi:glycosyltransferase involved in cell wall biosynthesis